MFVADLDAPTLDEGDLRHLLRALRLGPGEMVSVADGSGRWRLCRLGAAPRRAATGPVPLVVQSGIRDEPVISPPVTVAFAPTKGERPEWAVAKLTELGVDRIVPLVAGRAVVRWAGERADRHRQRWAEVARQAAMQCRRVRVPQIDVPSTVAALVAAEPGAVALADPGGPSPTLRRPTVLIGPEGGWTPEEEDATSARVGLGPSILRTETASVAAATLYVALRAGVLGSVPNETTQRSF